MNARTADRVRLTLGERGPGEDGPGKGGSGEGGSSEPGSGGHARAAVADLARLVGAAPAAGAWTYQSAPVAAHHRPYYIP